MSKSKDITGKRFGRLVAVRPTDRRGSGGGVFWEFECDCGERVVKQYSTKTTATSCGCARPEPGLHGAIHAAYTGDSVLIDLDDRPDYSLIH